ncbi:MAG: type II secretion system protein [Planctomycetota bacterium]
MKRAGKLHSSSGMTLLETAVVSALLFIVLGTLAQALSGVRSAAAADDVRAELQRQAERAMQSIVTDLRSSGFASQGGLDYPALFDATEPPIEFEHHQHAPVAKAARTHEADWGPNREIVFLLPADDDLDGRPDIDANGELIWDAREFSYVAVTDAEGRNRLQRRIAGASPRNIANSIERIVFDDTTSSGFEVPLSSIRIRLYLRQTDEAGRMHRYSTEATISLRNG